MLLFRAVSSFASASGFVQNEKHNNAKPARPNHWSKQQTFTKNALNNNANAKIQRNSYLSAKGKGRRRKKTPTKTGTFEIVWSEKQQQAILFVHCTATKRTNERTKRKERKVKEEGNTSMQLENLHCKQPDGCLNQAAKTKSMHRQQTCFTPKPEKREQIVFF